MGDPLSVASGVAGIISLGLQVTGSLIKYYDDYKDQDETVKRISDRLKTLRSSLQLLDTTVQDRKFSADESSTISAIDTSLFDCKEFIATLQKKCDKIQETNSQGLKGSIVLAGTRITYPFRKGTLEKLDETIRATQENLSIALNVLQLRDNQKLLSDTADNKQLIEILYARQISADIRQWLNAPDPIANHNINCAKRHPGTGSWFIQGDQFNTWLDSQNSFLWLTGFAGSGKSVLCSTAMLHTFRRRYTVNGALTVGIACFYFTFTDQSKQTVSGMLRSLILQLSSQCSDGNQLLLNLHLNHQSSTPSDQILMNFLEQIMTKFNQVYILLDALDEVPRGRSRRDLLDALKEINSWSNSGLHVLATSRDEVDINDRLPITRSTVVLEEGPGVNQDIEAFIGGQLKSDSDLLKWKKHHSRIKQVLAEKAHGVWVECQLESIRRCPRSVGQLDQCLKGLPEDLDQTYERILCGINGQSIRDAKRVLTALSYSRRPLTVSELIDIIAMEIGSSLGLNREFRYEDEDSLREICPGLIQIYVGSVVSPDDQYSPTFYVESVSTQSENGPFDRDGESSSSEQAESDCRLVRIAHFSVQEYLESSRIKEQKARNFALDKSTGHTELAIVCLSYLFESELATQDLVDFGDLNDLPLVDYAAEYWFLHYQDLETIDASIQELVLKLFNADASAKSNLTVFRNWLRIYDPESPWERRQLGDTSRLNAVPLYYACLLGIRLVVEEILNDRSTTIKEEQLRDAFQAASFGGRLGIVDMLLERGLNSDNGGEYGSALGAAAYAGREEIISLLLDRGADPNTGRSFKYGTALQTALVWGNKPQIALTLLDHGADINAEGGLRGNALSIAVGRCSEQTVEMLLERGADVNAPGGHHGTALEVAARFDRTEIIPILLLHGADVNAQGSREYGNALQAAASESTSRPVEMLLDAGAHINQRGGFYGCALFAACYMRNTESVKLLLERGADANSRGFDPERRERLPQSCLSCARENGLHDVEKLLLQHGAKDDEDDITERMSGIAVNESKD